MGVYVMDGGSPAGIHVASTHFLGYGDAFGIFAYDVTPLYFASRYEAINAFPGYVSRGVNERRQRGGRGAVGLAGCASP